jgi:stage V sporulation protein AA
VLIERTRCSKNRKIKQAFKIFVVSMVSFFGTAFAIMAYHVDVGINKVFSQVYGIVLGAEPEGLNVMSVSYSVGVAAGIIIFFNHVGGRRLTKDPTPIEVAMRKYEQDVDVTLIENADREGKEEDVR